GAGRRDLHHRPALVLPTPWRARRSLVTRRNCSAQTPYTASLAAFTGRTLRIFRAGFALNTVGSLVKGLMPLRSGVAGFLTTMNLAKPGSTNSPLFFNSL